MIAIYNGFDKKLTYAISLYEKRHALSGPWRFSKQLISGGHPPGMFPHLGSALDSGRQYETRLPKLH